MCRLAVVVSLVVAACRPLVITTIDACDRPLSDLTVDQDAGDLAESEVDAQQRADLLLRVVDASQHSTPCECVLPNTIDMACEFNAACAIGYCCVPWP